AYGGCERLGVRRLPLLAVDSTGVRAHRLAGRTHPPAAPDRGSNRLQSAGRAAGAVGAGEAAPEPGLLLSSVATIAVHVVPRAKKTEVAGRHRPATTSKVAAPPVPRAPSAE